MWTTVTTQKNRKRWAGEQFSTVILTSGICYTKPKGGITHRQQNSSQMTINHYVCSHTTRTQTAVSYLVWHQRGVRHYSLKRDQAKSRVFILCSSFLLDFTFQIPHLISSGTSHRRHSVITFRCNKYIWPWGVLRSVAKSSFQDFKITSAENSNTGISTSRRDCIETFLVVWKSPCSTSETNRQNAGEIIYPGW